MSVEQTISVQQLGELINAVYGEGDVVVKEAYSDVDVATRLFADARALSGEIRYRPGEKQQFFSTRCITARPRVMCMKKPSC